MPSVSASGVGSGTTAVLGTRFVQGLAATGAGFAKAALIAASGASMLVAGAVTLGRGRRLTAGAPLNDVPDASV